MKKFQFSLQTLLSVTISKDKQLKNEIKKLEELLSQYNKQLEELRNAYFEGKERCQEKMRMGIGSEDLAQYSNYFEYLIQKMVEIKQKIVDTEIEKDRLIQKRVQTQREIKTLERLKEDQYQEYLAEVQKEEEQEISDIVSYRSSV